MYTDLVCYVCLEKQRTLQLGPDSDENPNDLRGLLSTNLRRRPMVVCRSRSKGDDRDVDCPKFLTGGRQRHTLI
jgi:hypothetical protein